MSETAEISQQLNSLIAASEALGYSKGRTSLRQEILALVAEKYESAGEDGQKAYLAMSELMLDSFNRDVQDGEA